jgi:hypothetical protein
LAKVIEPLLDSMANHYSSISQSLIAITDLQHDLTKLVSNSLNSTHQLATLVAESLQAQQMLAEAISARPLELSDKSVEVHNHPPKKRGSDFAIEYDSEGRPVKLKQVLKH